MRTLAVVLVVGLALVALAPSAHAAPLSEDDKIEALIRTVDQLKGATFVRNGSTYDCHDAAKHMRDKWKWKKDVIHSARDFIVVAASFSTQTGKPYLIRWQDGRELKSAEFLATELRKLEAP